MPEFEYSDGEDTKKIDVPDSVVETIKKNAGENDVKFALERYNQEMRKAFPELLEGVAKDAKLKDLIGEVSKKIESLGDKPDGKESEDTKALKERLAKLENDLSNEKKSVKRNAKFNEVKSLIAGQVSDEFKNDLDDFLGKSFDLEETESGDLRFINPTTSEYIQKDGAPVTSEQMADIFREQRKGIFTQKKKGGGLNGQSSSGAGSSGLDLKNASSDALVGAGLSELKIEKRDL